MIQALPPISKRIIGEDAISFRRAHLLGEVLYILDVLVRYRTDTPVGLGNISRRRTGTAALYLAEAKRWALESLYRYSVYRADIDALTPHNSATLIETLDDELARNHALVEFLNKLPIMCLPSFSKYLFLCKTKEQIKEAVKLFMLKHGLTWRLRL